MLQMKGGFFQLVSTSENSQALAQHPEPLKTCPLGWIKIVSQPVASICSVWEAEGGWAAPTKGLNFE
jgi:hypothetical protein